ncbi:hypothetical protein EAG_13843 [Camponotus floridanus]|uniref:Uncharacterized protein n=1 Tax=Camponotus floridanus TaxID=104421 RepID=E2AVL2_CAMFO|nr:hypothetical protein EAG_13843 [Camponotus floridanus]
MFGRTFDSGILVVDTKECRKRPEKFKSRRKEGGEEEEGRQSTVIRSKVNIPDGGGIGGLKRGCLSQIVRQILANVRSAWRRRRLIIVIIRSLHPRAERKAMLLTRESTLPLTPECRTLDPVTSPRWQHVFQSQATDSHNDLLRRWHRGDLHLNRRRGDANKTKAGSATTIAEGREETRENSKEQGRREGKERTRQRRRRGRKGISGGKASASL